MTYRRPTTVLLSLVLAVLAVGCGSGPSESEAATPREELGMDLAIDGWPAGDGVSLSEGSYGVLGSSGRLEAVFTEGRIKVVLLGVPPEEPATPTQVTVALEIANPASNLQRKWLARDGECTITFAELPPGDISGSITCGTIASHAYFDLDSVTGTFRAVERSG